MPNSPNPPSGMTSSLGPVGARAAGVEVMAVAVRAYGRTGLNEESAAACPSARGGRNTAASPVETGLTVPSVSDAWVRPG
jgi:hypothetical protein